MTDDKMVRLVTKEQKVKLREQAIGLLKKENLDPTEDRVKALTEKLISLKKEGYVVAKNVAEGTEHDHTKPHYVYNHETKEWELKSGKSGNPEYTFPKK